VSGIGEISGDDLIPAQIGDASENDEHRQKPIDRQLPEFLPKLQDQQNDDLQRPGNPSGSGECREYG
jgi:hypothetical protein